MADDKDVVVAYPDDQGNYHNIIGTGPHHGHVVVDQQGNVTYGRDQGESRDNPSIPDTKK